MRRVALLAAVLIGWAAVPAAGWIELPPRPIAGDGVADCLRAAGPGQLALLGGQGRGASAVDLFTVGAQAVVPGDVTVLGRLAACPEIGGAPGVKPVLVAPVARGVSSEPALLRVVDAGSTPMTLGTEAGIDSGPSVAVSPSGAAVVAWSQIVPGPEPIAARVFAAVRPAAGAPFGPVVMLGAGSPFASQPSVGIDAAGHATVLWISRRTLGRPALLDIATTTGNRFLTRQLASAAGDQVALAVSSAGRTLVVNAGSNSLLAYERAPGASTFVPVPVPASSSPDEMAVAVADDGGAVIAYRVDSSLGGVGSAVSAFALLRRPGEDGFGREQVLEGSPDNGDFSGFGFVPSIGTSSSPVPDDRGPRIAAALDAFGHVLLTWVNPGNRGGAASAHVASGTVSGGMAHSVRLGNPCRAANAAQPLKLADGTLGAAWTDNARAISRDSTDTPLGGGLLHVIMPGEGTTSAGGTPPGLSAQLIGSLALHGGQPLRLRVRCRRGPCIVRAAATAYSLDGSSGDPSLVDGSVELRRRHAGLLSLDPADGDTLARSRDATAQVSLLACAPTGTRAAHLTLALRLHRLPPLPVPRVVNLVARRHGDTIDVTWRTTIPARNTTFDIAGQPFDPTQPVYAEIAGRGRRQFSIVLHSAPSVHERAVSVQVNTGDHPDGNSVATRIR